MREGREGRHRGVRNPTKAEPGWLSSPFVPSWRNAGPERDLIEPPLRKSSTEDTEKHGEKGGEQVALGFACSRGPVGRRQGERHDGGRGGEKSGNVRLVSTEGAPGLPRHPRSV